MESVEIWNGNDMIRSKCPYGILSIDIHGFIERFSEHAEFQWWQMLIIGIIMLALNLVLFLVFTYVRVGNVLEYGFPKIKNKTLRKKIKSYSLLDRILLIKLTADAKRRGFFLILNLAGQFLNIISMLLCLVGFVGSMITLADGWCLMLLIASVIVINLTVTAIMFIPDLIYLPSERKKYTFFR